MQTLSASSIPFESPRPRSSAVKAGWICLAIGVCTFWIVGLGFLFIGTAHIMAIVALCDHRIRQGVALLISSVAAMVLCVVLFLTLVIGTAGVAVQKAAAEAERKYPTPPTFRLPR